MVAEKFLKEKLSQQYTINIKEDSTYNDEDIVIFTMASIMNDFALHIAEQAVEEEKNEISEGMIQSFQGEKKHGQLYVCDKILSRIKQLTEEE